MKLLSKPAVNLGLYIITIAVGLLLMWLARDFSSSGTGERAGFLLGCLVFALGAMGLVIGESRSVELDERRKRIVLEVRRRVGADRRIEIPFSEIREFGIAVLGSRCDGSRYYDLVLTLHSGKEVYLFGGCVFEGRMSRNRMEDLRASFEKAAFL